MTNLLRNKGALVSFMIDIVVDNDIFTSHLNDMLKHFQLSSCMPLADFLSSPYMVCIHDPPTFSFTN